MIFGIDISHHNSSTTSPFPLHLSKEEKVDFVIAKASQGYCPSGVQSRPYNFKDRWFDRHRRAARQSGLVFGAYHWLMRDSELTGNGRQQAEFFVRSLAPGRAGTVDGGQKAALGLLLAVDVERTAFGTGEAEDLIDGRPSWRVLQGFIAGFRELLPGHPLLIYGNAGSGAAITEHDVAGLGDTYLWYACWNGFEGHVRDAKPGTVSTWHPGIGGFGSATMVQFSSDAHFGSRPRVDANAFRGTLQQLTELTQAGPEDTAHRKLYRRGYRSMVKAMLAEADTITPEPIPGTAEQVGHYSQGATEARESMKEYLRRSMAPA